MGNTTEKYSVATEAGKKNLEKAATFLFWMYTFGLDCYKRYMHQKFTPLFIKHMLICKLFSDSGSVQSEHSTHQPVGQIQHLNMKQMKRSLFLWLLFSCSYRRLAVTEYTTLCWCLIRNSGEFEVCFCHRKSSFNRKKKFPDVSPKWFIL